MLEKWKEGSGPGSGSGGRRPCLPISARERVPLCRSCQASGSFDTHWEALSVVFEKDPSDLGGCREAARSLSRVLP